MSSVPTPTTSSTEPPAEPPTARAVLREAAPRMLRDALGPLVAFYLGWKLVGLAVGILAAFTIGLARRCWRARREGRPGAIVRLVLAIVCVRAVVGLIGGSDDRLLRAGRRARHRAGHGVPRLARPRPAARRAVRRRRLSTSTRRSARRPSTARSSPGSRSPSASSSSPRAVDPHHRAGAPSSDDAYVATAAILDAPVLLGMLAWSISYSVRRFRRTPEWEMLFG